MKIYKIFWILSLAVLINCDDKNEQAEDMPKTSSETDLQIVTAKDIERFKYKDYGLSKDAQQATLSWSKYKELETQVSFLKRADVSFFTSDADTLKAFFVALKETTPENLKTNPIEARLSVLQTRILKFNSELTLDNYLKEDKLKSILEILKAKANLIYLINKKLEFDKNDVERPFDIERSVDSITTLTESLENSDIIK